MSWLCIFFPLSNMSFNIYYSSNSVSFLLFIGLRDGPTISHTNCYTKITITFLLGMTECLLLAVMAYDRSVAISNPLLYIMIVNNQVCTQLAMVTWASDFFLAIIPTLAIPDHFCGHNIINHFICEIQNLLKLFCSDTLVRIILGLVIGIFTLPPSVLCLHHYLLYLRCSCHTEDSLCRVQAQSFLYLWIPYDCDHHVS